MHRILFEIGNFPIYSYGAMIALAFIVAILVAMNEAKKSGENQERILDISLRVIIGALIGGRLIYVFTYLDYYLKDPIKILYIRQGGLSFLGGFLFAVILAWLYVKKNQLIFWKYADICSPAIAIGLGIGRIGCLLNGCCFGVITDSYGIKFPAEHLPPAYLQHLKDGLISQGSACSLPVVPTQIYSSIYGFAIFLILLRISKPKRYDGFTFLMFLILYSVARFSIEFFRFYENRIVLFKIFSITQVVCIIVIIFAIFMMRYLKKIQLNKRIIE